MSDWLPTQKKKFNEIQTNYYKYIHELEIFSNGIIISI